jgi:hypothetical protein
MSVGYYVGSTKTGAKKVFRSVKAPTKLSHGDTYTFVVGPFSSKSEAEKMVKQLKGSKR